ncbi:MAG: DUF3298 and DUF4163 domain-containing protein [Clostridia bacterium]
MKRLILILGVFLLLYGCAPYRSAHFMITPKQYETDFSSVEAEELSFSGMENTDFQTELNTKLSDELSSSLINFDSLAQENSSNVTMGNKSVFNNKWEEKYNKNNFISLINEEYIYLGGAHGSTAWYPLNIDTAAGKTLTLDDLFSDPGYKDTLNRMINELIEKNPDEYKDLWEKPEIKESNQKDFYILDNKLVIFYQPYDLSYYARGFVEFPLKLEELSGHLKEEYRRLIPTNANQPKVKTTQEPNS